MEDKQQKVTIFGQLQEHNKISFLALAILLFVVFIGSAAFLAQRNQTNNPPTQTPQLTKTPQKGEGLKIDYFNPPRNTSGYTWRLSFLYNNQTDHVSLEELTTLDTIINQDFRNDVFSPLTLIVIDTNNQELYKTQIALNTIPVQETFTNNTIITGSIPVSSQTTVFIPYQKNGSKILIKKQNQTILEYTIPQSELSAVPKDLSFAPFDDSCRKAQVVFVNDGYANVSEFRDDVKKIITQYQNTEPYASAGSFFDFQSIETRQNLGCSNYNVCLSNPRIKDIVVREYPNVSKIIVLVGNSQEFGGAANRLGGDIGVVSKGSEGDERLLDVAVHEFLGHAFGALHDRYLYPAQQDQALYNQLLSGSSPRSNCTDNRNGEAFWHTTPGQSGAYAGCSSRLLYAPYPLDCATPSKGPRISMMSACRQTLLQPFDPVETAWIKNNILPMYTTCQNPNPTPDTTTPEPNPDTTIPGQNPPPMAPSSTPTTSASCFGGNYYCSGQLRSCSSLKPINGSCAQAQKESCSGYLLGSICGTP